MKQSGFTIVEVIIVVVVIGILASITSIGVTSWQHRTSTAAVKSDLQLVSSSMQSYLNFNNYYPPNFDGTGFVSSNKVAVSLYTNTGTTLVYTGLSPDQNAQLFLNTCNAILNPLSNVTTCEFAGKNSGAKVHVKGTSGANEIWNSPISEADIAISPGCNSECTDALAELIATFEAQGGQWDVNIPNSEVAMPEPTVMISGQADRYCAEGHASSKPEISYYVNSTTKQVTQGVCDRTGLGYPSAP